MPELINKLTSMVTSTTSALTLLFVAVAVGAIIVVAILYQTSGTNDERKTQLLKTLGWILAACIICAGASGLVSWAMA